MVIFDMPNVVKSIKNKMPTGSSDMRWSNFQCTFLGCITLKFYERLNYDFTP